jgi:hypothetical protein
VVEQVVYRTSFPGGTKISLLESGSISVPVTIGAGGAGSGNLLMDHQGSIMDLLQYFQQLHQQVVVEHLTNSGNGSPGGSGGGASAPYNAGSGPGGSGNRSTS